MNPLGKDFENHIRDNLFENPKTYNYKKFNYYCNGYLDWNDINNVRKTKTMKSNTGWTWLQDNVKTRGQLSGGYIEVLEFMKETKYWPNENFWKDKILFFETSEDKPSPNQVKWLLRNYRLQGIFNKISALLIGRPRDYSDIEKNELDENIIKIVKNEFKNKDLPVITNMDFCHTDPQWIMPLGIKAEIDCHKKEFKLIEKIFKD